MSSAPAKSAEAQFNGSAKRSQPGSGQPRKKKQKLQASARVEGSYDEVIAADIRELLRDLRIDDKPGQKYGEDSKADTIQLPERFTDVEVKITSLSSTGDGLGAIGEGSSHVYVVPFSVPGDTVLARVIRHDPQSSYTITDFVKVLVSSPQRDDSLARCPYFSTCSGCQFQMLPYQYQLAHKKTIVEKAYRNFSGLAPHLVPKVGDTIGSPLQYGYRTKLTPHFDGPRGGRRAARKGETPKFEEVPPIGFMKKGTRQTLDIEECPIGTEVVQMGLRRERKRIAKEIGKYKRGATILLRESTNRIARNEDESEQGLDEEKQTIYEESSDHIHAKTCITDNNATTTEYVDQYIFQNPANAFFQNNNSILPTFTAYIRDHILPPPTALLLSGATTPATSQIKNLIDAYSGSGLFTITLSTLFSHSIGIDISPESITFARKNAQLNHLTSPTSPTPTSAVESDTSYSQSNLAPSTGNKRSVQFLAADATTLFADVPSFFTPAETAIVIDPPRKGCDESFLKQLVTFGPARIVYVSCNVHTQARDIGWILRAGKDSEDGADSQKKAAEASGDYEIESLQGFHFFPQTGHVEVVAVLSRKKQDVQVQ